MTPTCEPGDTYLTWRDYIPNDIAKYFTIFNSYGRGNGNWYVESCGLEQDRDDADVLLHQ